MPRSGRSGSRAGRDGRASRRPEETAAQFTPDGFSRSGDLGRMDADGYVRVTGRLKDVVIRGGMNISVRQVEDLLTEHPAVGAVAVVAMPDPRMGEKACRYLVPAAGYGEGGEETLTLEAIRDYLLGHGLVIQKVPERLEVVDALPMTATGKIQKPLLRADIAAKPRAAATDAGTGTGTGTGTDAVARGSGFAAAPYLVRPIV